MKPCQHHHRAANPSVCRIPGTTAPWWRWGVVVLGVWGGVMLVGCGDQEKKKKPPEPVAEVSYPIHGTVTDHEVFTGRTEPFQNVDVKPLITGQLLKIHFRDGQFVKEGELLFTIDPELFQANVDKAKADLASNKAKVVQTEALYRRALNLLTSKAGVQEDVDIKRGDWAVAQASVAQGEAMLRLAQINLSYTKIHAPISGRISKRMVDAGNVVEANKTVLTNIVSNNPIYATFYVDERTRLRVVRLVDLGKVESARIKEVPVQMSLADESRFVHPGTINFVDNQVDPQTGTLRVRGIFRNLRLSPTFGASVVGLETAPLGQGPLWTGATLYPKDTDIGQLLTPGLFVRVQVPIGAQHKAILVSEAALGTDQGRKFLFVVNDQNVIVNQPVTIGALQNNGLRVIEEGLHGNERIIVTGLQRFRADLKVQPKIVAMPAQGADKTLLVTNATTQGK